MRKWRSAQGSWWRRLVILDRRNEHRSVRRKQDYLLKGIVFYRSYVGDRLVRLSGSTSNAGRSGGGTSYYRVASAGGVSFLCRDIDEQIPLELLRISRFLGSRRGRSGVSKSAALRDSSVTNRLQVAISKAVFIGWMQPGQRRCQRLLHFLTLSGACRSRLAKR